MAPLDSPASPGSFLQALLAPSPAVAPQAVEVPRQRLNSAIIAPAGFLAGSGGNGSRQVSEDGRQERIDGGGWTLVDRSRRRIDGPAGGARSGPLVPSRFRALLLKRAWGRCFRCLASNHRVAECRNPAVCLLCGKVGHRARWCRGADLPPPLPSRAAGAGPAPRVGRAAPGSSFKFAASC